MILKQCYLLTEGGIAFAALKLHSCSSFHKVTDKIRVHNVGKM